MVDDKPDRSHDVFEWHFNQGAKMSMSTRATGFLLLLTCPLSAQNVRTENFTTAPSWLLTGTGANNNTFGHQPTSLAGGLSGEAGGMFTRSNFDRIYADGDLGGSLSLTTPFSASGRLEVRNAMSADLGPGLELGHFNASNHATIGLFFNQDLTSTDGLYLDAIIRRDAMTAYQVRLSTSPSPNLGVWAAEE